jgi:hypothetical protein
VNRGIAVGRHAGPVAPPPSSRVWLPIALAASLMLTVLGVSWYWVARPRPVPPGSLAERNSAAGSPRPDATGSESASPQLRGDGWLISTSLLELYPEEARQRHRQQVTRIADNLRPLAAPFNAAVTVLQRTLPVQKADEEDSPRAARDAPAASPWIT